MADFLNNSNVAVAGRTNANRDLVTSPNYLRWLAQGKVFEAGFGVESTPADSQAAIDDTLVTFALQAPSADSPLVIPILLKLMMVADGGALTRIDVAFTKPASQCATALALSGGRAMLGGSLPMYRTTAKSFTAQASALYGAATTFAITSTALVAADYISFHYDSYIDAALTVMTQPPVKTFNFLLEGLPHILTNGAAMLVYINTGTSDSTWIPYMQWAELTEDDLV